MKVNFKFEKTVGARSASLGGHHTRCLATAGKSEIPHGEIVEALEIEEPQLIHKLPDFSHVEKAFEHQTIPEMMRAWIVLRVCAIEFIVRNADSLLLASRKVFGERLTAAIIKRTFFAHFCAAEDHIGLLPVIERLESSGVSGILDYAAEADLDSSREERELEVVARTYDYEGEKQCDAATEVFEECIRTAHSVAQHSKSGKHPFAAIKVTALGNPQLLKRMSEMILETRRLFLRMEKKLEREPIGSFSLEEWRYAFNEYFDDPVGQKNVDSMFWNAIGSTPDDYSGPNEPRLDLVDWCRSGNINVVSTLVKSCRNQGPLFNVTLTPEELELSLALFNRLDRLCSLAEELGVRLMIDAEQTYFQPCIDANVLRLQRKFNAKGSATIFGTYQCYLKGADKRIAEDLERSKREGWKFAAKLVRGAYMVSERALAEEQGRESPIYDTIEETHDCYHRSIDMLLKDEQAEVLLATHNQASCEYAAKRMDELKIPREGGGVYFGQLLGMADHVTYTLGLCGYSAFKYVPYGKVYEVLPYLIRRAQENSGLVSGATYERDLIKNEIASRLFGRKKQ